MASEYFAHDTAIVEEGVLIGSDTKLWHHCHVRSGARIGALCVLGKNVFVDSAAVVGNGVKIQNNVSVYNGVEIADDVFIGPSAVLTNDRVPRAFAESWELVQTYIGKGASIGANATIVCGNTVGEYGMVAAGSVVTRSVEDHQLVAGNPARPIGWICWCGVVVSREEIRPGELWCSRHLGTLERPMAAVKFSGSLDAKGALHD